MGCGRRVVRGVLVHDHDTEAQGTAPVATRVSGGLGWLSPWSFSWESVLKTLLQDLAGADVFNQRYCQSQGLKPTWEGGSELGLSSRHVWERLLARAWGGPQTWPFSAGSGAAQNQAPRQLLWSV